jgi:hypothetical protein
MDRFLLLLCRLVCGIVLCLVLLTAYQPLRLRNYLQFRATLVNQILQTDELDNQRHGDKRDERDQGDYEDACMEDVVMGGTSPD